MRYKEENDRCKLTQCCRQLKSVPVDDFPAVSISFLHRLKVLGSQAVCCLILEWKPLCVTNILLAFHEATHRASQGECKAIRLFGQEESGAELLLARDSVKGAFAWKLADCCNSLGCLRAMMMEDLKEQPADQDSSCVCLPNLRTLEKQFFSLSSTHHF